MSPEVRILITGGRVGVDDRVCAKALTVIAGSLGEVLVFGDGDAVGYDRLARAWAKAQGFRTETFHVDRKLDGDRDDAPKRRNLRMFNTFHPDVCVAFPGGPGTRHMWMHCFDHRLPVYSVEVENNHLHVSRMLKGQRAITLYSGPLT